MLAGVGGATVEEAQERMSYAEFISWAAYAKRHGGLNLGLRLEEGFALVASVLAQLHGKRLSPEHFKPKRGQEEAPADLMAVFNMLLAKASETRAARGGAGRKKAVR